MWWCFLFFLGTGLQDRRSKEQKKHANWQIKVCHKICAEQNFPNNEIIEMYLSQNQGNFNGMVSIRTNCFMSFDYICNLNVKLSLVFRNFPMFLYRWIA